MSLTEILTKVEQIEKREGPHRCVSLTGGEPLLYAEILRPLCRVLRKKKFRVLLETSGILWRQLATVVADCDIIAMDLKLPSVTKQRDFLSDHRAFLRIAKKKDVYAKVVVSGKVDVCELEKHLRMVASVAPETPVFLQPLSVSGKSYPDLLLMKLLNELQRAGAKQLLDVRVGIQLHKVLNVR